MKRIIIILMVGLITKVLTGYPVLKNPELSVNVISDSKYYTITARNLLKYHIFSHDSIPPIRPTAHWTPGFPFFLSLIIRICGLNYLCVIFIQVLLSLITALVVYKFIMLISKREDIAFWGAIMFSIEPNLSFYYLQIMTEPLFMFFFMSFLFFLFKYLQENHLGNIILASVLMGISIYVRVVVLYFPVLVVLFIILNREQEITRKLMAGILFLFLTYLLIVPWYMRNRKVFGSGAVATEGYYIVYWGMVRPLLASVYNLPMDKVDEIMEKEEEKALEKVPNVNDVTRGKVCFKLGMKHIIKHPMTYLKMHITSSLVNLFEPISFSIISKYFSGGVPPPTRNIMAPFLSLIGRGRVFEALGILYKERIEELPIGATLYITLSFIFNIVLWIGIIKWFINSRDFLEYKSLFLWLTVFYFILITGANGDARFRVPIEPILFYFSARGYLHRDENTPA